MRRRWRESSHQQAGSLSASKCSVNIALSRKQHYSSLLGHYIMARSPTICRLVSLHYISFLFCYVSTLLLSSPFPLFLHHFLITLSLSSFQHVLTLVFAVFACFAFFSSFLSPLSLILNSLLSFYFSHSITPSYLSSFFPFSPFSLFTSTHLLLSSFLSFLCFFPSSVVHRLQISDSSAAAA